MMFRMLELWSKFIIWLCGGFKGVPDLKDAWFVGSPTLYSGIVVWVGALPVSSKGWALFLALCVYLLAVFFAFNDLGLPMVLYVLLGLLGMVVFYRIAPPKTYWVTRENFRELWGR
jgi:hypothetical protein